MEVVQGKQGMKEGLGNEDLIQLYILDTKSLSRKLYILNHPNRFKDWKRQDSMV